MCFLQSDGNLDNLTQSVLGTKRCLFLKYDHVHTYIHIIYSKTLSLSRHVFHSMVQHHRVPLAVGGHWLCRWWWHVFHSMVQHHTVPLAVGGHWLCRWVFHSMVQHHTVPLAVGGHWLCRWWWHVFHSMVQHHTVPLAVGGHWLCRWCLLLVYQTSYKDVFVVCCLW